MNIQVLLIIITVEMYFFTVYVYIESLFPIFADK